LISTVPKALLASATKYDICNIHYSNKQFDFPEHKVKATAVIKVEIESMTGKQAGF